MTGNIVAGIDEVGRGALAGPVVACCVVFKPSFPFTHLLSDSKQLSPSRRRTIASIIRPHVHLGTGIVSHRQIDAINVLQATLMAMTLSLRGCAAPYHHVIIDGNRIPPRLRHHPSIQAVVKADQTIPSVKAASIFAKVIRDNHMVRCHDQYPHYGFNQHVGYGTPHHIAALNTHGACPIHRVTFNRVRTPALS